MDQRFYLETGFLMWSIGTYVDISWHILAIILIIIINNV